MANDDITDGLSAIDASKAYFQTGLMRENVLLR